MIESAAAVVAKQLTTDFPTIRHPDHWIWGQCPPAKVIDCVLSLRKNYVRVVEPRVRRFTQQRPEVATCSDLRRLMDGYSGLEEFIATELTMAALGRRRPSRAWWTI